MKKIASTIIFVLFLFIIISPVFAITAKQEIERLQNENAILQSKLKTTKDKTQIKRINSSINKNQVKISQLQKTLVEESKTASSIKPKKVEGKNIAIAKIGLGGGSVLISGSYLVPSGSFYLGGEAGYGIGNQFGVLEFGVVALYPMEKNFVGINLVSANYSQTVQGVPGVSGNISGGNFGIGAFYGMTFSKNIQAEVGYNTALGLTLNAGYRF